MSSKTPHFQVKNIFFRSVKAFKALLPQDLIDGDGHRIGEIETAECREHRNTQSAVDILIDKLGGKSNGLTPENEKYAVGILYLGIG